MKGAILGMRLGMALAVGGGVLLLTAGLLTGKDLGLIGGMVGWGCGASTVVYVSALRAIARAGGEEGEGHVRVL